MKKLILLSFLLSLYGQSQAQRSKSTKNNASTITQASVEHIVRTLAADDMQGRASGTPGGLKAAQFIAGEFKRIGLQPLTGLTNFEQVFTAYDIHSGEAKVELNGAPVPADRVLVASGVPQLAWSDKDSPVARVVVIGPDAKVGQELRPLLQPHENLVVLVDPAHTAYFQRFANYFGQNAIRAEKPEPYASVFILSAPSPTLPTYRITATTIIKPVQLRNVVGVLPGRDKTKAAEMVVFSGHYDHLGVRPAVAGDSIANGADDDASGTTAVITLAEYFKKKKDNARTLVFVAFAAEESGGFGSQYFSKQLDPAKVVAMFNIEMIGKVAQFGPNTAFITGYERSDFGKLLQQNLQGTAFRFEPDPYLEQSLFYRSDNATLARLGVPAHSISTDQIPTDKLYHSVDDEVESLDLANMTAVIQGIAQSASGIISGQQTPTRIAPESVGQRP
ncbi:M20/M25/M40 family metallo-hydrolase [Hymenobacter crusticola]|uniref:Peptidase M28 domain-containing protein n=1 Tax=Hymenobacter crusticola TaxID=1770526 RepID=A0A243WCK3_9BACT|nr:M20/M25/M40 family metallo-hydrolase [Hymenobacter crusticola]OUJ72747.1 hypothetical protein BXP70_17170 [Hymenobacter crusticola]